MNEASSPLRFLGEEMDGQDWLGFGSIVDPLYDRIDSGAASQSYTVAILADWGSGKTTLLRMLKSRLDRRLENAQAISAPERDKLPLTVWFDAWRYDTADAVWKGLITVFYRAILQHQTLYSEYRRKSDRIKETLATSAGGILDKLLEGLFGFSTPLEKLADAIAKEQWSPTLHHEFDEAMDRILSCLGGTRTPRSVVLFIDDLDRCTPEAAVEVLLATKQVLNKAGLVVVMAVSPKQIQSAIESRMSRSSGTTPDAGPSNDDSQAFLRKFVQVPLPILPVTRYEFEGYLIRCFEESGLGEHAPFLLERPWLEWIAAQFKTTNLRAAKSFVNALVAALLRATRSQLPWCAEIEVTFQKKQVFVTLLHQQYEEAWHHFADIVSGPAGLMAWQRWAADQQGRKAPGPRFLTTDSQEFLKESLDDNSLVPLFEGATDVERHLRLSSSVPLSARPVPKGLLNLDVKVPPPDELRPLIEECNRLSSGAFRGSLADVRVSRWKAPAPEASLAALTAASLVNGTPSTVGNDLGDIIALAQALGFLRWSAAVLKVHEESFVSKDPPDVPPGIQPLTSRLYFELLRARQAILEGKAIASDYDRLSKQLEEPGTDPVMRTRALQCLVTLGSVLAGALAPEAQRAMTDPLKEALGISAKSSLLDTQEFLQFRSNLEKKGCGAPCTRFDLKLMYLARQHEHLDGGHIFVSAAAEDLPAVSRVIRIAQATDPRFNFVIHPGMLPFRASWLDELNNAIDAASVVIFFPSNAGENPHARQFDVERTRQRHAAGLVRTIRVEPHDRVSAAGVDTIAADEIVNAAANSEKKEVQLAAALRQALDKVLSRPPQNRPMRSAA